MALWIIVDCSKIACYQPVITIPARVEFHLHKQPNMFLAHPSQFLFLLFWVLKGEEGGMTTPLLQYVARFDGGGEIFGFGGGGYKESWSWCSLFVEYPSLFVATSGEKPALRRS